MSSLMNDGSSPRPISIAQLVAGVSFVGLTCRSASCRRVKLVRHQLGGFAEARPLCVSRGLPRRASATRRAPRGALPHVLLRLHLRPINLVVFQRPYSAPKVVLDGRSHLRKGFVLICFQRLSRPNLATRQCRWHDNRYTIGSSIPVLSY